MGTDDQPHRKSNETRRLLNISFSGDPLPEPENGHSHGNAWAALSVYLDFCKIISPAEVSYQVCIDYPNFRSKPPRELMRARSHNTALTELKVFSALMQEAVRRGYAVANPCVRLGLKRRLAKVKPEITAEEERKIEAAL